MHIPDGYLNPETCIAAYGAMVPVWAIAAKKLRSAIQSKEVPLLAAGAAFSFLLMMFNFPLPGGSSGHAVGGALLAILLGPSAAISILSVVLAIQALLFHDGGITTFGANAFSMAFILPVASSIFYRIFSRAGDSIKKRAIVGAISGYIGLSVSAFTTAIILGIQPHGPAGYAPYPLSITIPVMMGSHLLVFSWIEAIVTGSVLFWILRYSEIEAAPVRPLRTVYLVIIALIFLSPLGLLANKTPFGEWSKTELTKMLGYVPSGMQKEFWSAPFSAYRIGNHSIVIGYLFSALLGTLAVSLLVLMLGQAAAKKRAALDDLFLQLANLEDCPRRNGFLQRVHPNIKVIGFIFLAVLSIWISNGSILAALIGSAIFLAVASKIPMSFFLKIMIGTTAVFTFLIAAPALFTRFSPGIHAIVLLTLRSAAAIGWTSLLALSTSWYALIESLKCFKIPRAFLFVLEMAFRYIYLFIRLFENMLFSKEARTFSPASLKNEQRWSANALSFLFKRSLDLSENVYSAMISRGYH